MKDRVLNPNIASPKWLAAWEEGKLRAPPQLTTDRITDASMGSAQGRKRPTKGLSTLLLTISVIAKVIRKKQIHQKPFHLKFSSMNTSVNKYSGAQVY